MAKTMTSSFRHGRGDSLSYRLTSIREAFKPHHKHVWDIGCDHGLLGLSFAEEDIESINLVDPSASVIDVLKENTKDSYISKPALNIIQSEGQNLTIPASSNCFFIAGMGGKEIFQILLNLIPQLDSTSTITISPHRWIRELREKLADLPVSLFKEEVIYDERFYEILTLIPQGIGKKVPPFGEEMWGSETGKKYREHQISTMKTHKDEASMAYLQFLQSLKQ